MVRNFGPRWIDGGVLVLPHPQNPIQYTNFKIKHTFRQSGLYGVQLTPLGSSHFPIYSVVLKHGELTRISNRTGSHFYYWYQDAEGLEDLPVSPTRRSTLFSQEETSLDSVQDKCSCSECTRGCAPWYIRFARAIKDAFALCGCVHIDKHQ